MRKITLALLGLIATAFAVQAHFVFIVPQPDGKSVRVVLSEDLDADENVTAAKIAKLELKSTLPDGKTAAVETKASEHYLTGTFGSTKPQVVYGSLHYGVMQRGDAKPYLLMYHAKAVLPGANAAAATAEVKAPIEIVPTILKGEVAFTVIAAGKSLAETEVTVVLPAGSDDGKRVKVMTDKAGKTKAFTAKGMYGAWAKTTDTKAGELEGKKYDEVRHYGTLTVELPK